MGQAHELTPKTGSKIKDNQLRGAQLLEGEMDVGVGAVVAGLGLL
jgi:hypothetical protein